MACSIDKEVSMSHMLHGTAETAEAVVRRIAEEGAASVVEARQAFLAARIKLILLIPPTAMAVFFPALGWTTLVVEPLWVREGSLRLGQTGNFVWLAMAVLPIFASFLLLGEFAHAAFLAEDFYSKRDLGKSTSTADPSVRAEFSPLHFEQFVSRPQRVHWSLAGHMALIICFVLGVLYHAAWGHQHPVIAGVHGLPVSISIMVCCATILLCVVFAPQLRVAILLRYRKSTARHVSKLAFRTSCVIIFQVFFVCHASYYFLHAPPLVSPVAFYTDSHIDNLAVRCRHINQTWIEAHCYTHHESGEQWFGPSGSLSPIGPSGMTCHDHGSHFAYHSLYAECLVARISYTLQFGGLASVTLCANMLLPILFAELFSAFRLSRTPWEEWVRFRAPVLAYVFAAFFAIAVLCIPIKFATMLESEPYASADADRQRVFRFPTVSLLTGFVNAVAWIACGIVVIILHRLQNAKVSSATHRVFRYDAFLSYRVASDRELVEKIYDKLCLLGFKPYLDKRCLKQGLSFTDDFSSAIFGKAMPCHRTGAATVALCGLPTCMNAPADKWLGPFLRTTDTAVFVPILSHEGLQPLVGKDPATDEDNLLLEHRLGLELKHRGSIRSLHPVLVGKLVPAHETEIGPSRARIGELYANFFSFPWPPLPQSPLVKVEEQVASQLAKNAESGVHFSDSEASAAETIKKLCAFQGSILEGNPFDAIERAVAQIAQCIIETRSASELDAMRREGRTPSVANGTANAHALHLTILRGSTGWFRRQRTRGLSLMSGSLHGADPA